MGKPVEKEYVIIGAGPTGIGAAMRLIELGIDDFIIIESNSEAGGLSSSVVDEKGFTWDFGGHVLFSHYQKFDDYMDLALGKDGWINHERESWIWIRDRFIPYPFQNNLHRLPNNEKWDCIKGLVKVAREASNNQDNFKEWIVATFGKGIADLFLLPYNFKVWAFPPELMNRNWVGERVAVPDLETVLKSICLDQDNISWGPNNLFRFPVHGGTGAIWRNLSDRLPSKNKSFSESVIKIDSKNKTITTNQDRIIRYHHLISTMPVDKLTRVMGDEYLVTLSSKLLFSSVHVVGIGMLGVPPEHLKKKCWMYFPESNCPFYRVTVFSNYSAYNTPLPSETWSLMAEVSQSPVKSIDTDLVVDAVIQGLKTTQLITNEDKIISSWHRCLLYGYPTPSLERDAILIKLLPSLEELGIFSRGRFGSWRYEVGNQDHSFMQGIEVVDHIICGYEEMTMNHPNIVNTRNNIYPYKEWNS